MWLGSLRGCSEPGLAVVAAPASENVAPSERRMGLARRRVVAVGLKHSSSVWMGANIDHYEPTLFCSELMSADTEINPGWQVPLQLVS